MKKILPLLLLLFTGLYCHAQQPNLTSEQRELIKQAEFKTLDGKLVKLSDYKGKVLILDFWETWCGPCLNLMPTLDKIAKEYKKDVVLLAISPGFSDELADVQEFATKKGYDFTYLFATKLARDLRIYSIPYRIYVDANGEVIKAEIGGSPNVEFEYKKIIEEIEKYKSKK